MPTMTFSAVESDLVDGPPPSWLHPEQDMLHHHHRHHQQQQGGDFLDTNNSVMQLLSTDNGWNANQRQQHDRSLQNQNQQQLDWQQQMQQQQQQQQQPNWQGNNYYAENQQQQFEQNVQNMFGIGQTPSAETNMMYDKGSYNYDPYASTNNTQDVNTHAFLVALSFNAIIFLFLISSYEMFRKWFPSVYAPKIVRDGGGATGSVGGTPKSLSRTSSRLSLTKAGGDINTAPAVNINTRLPLGWIRGVAHASWSSVRSTGGLDSYMFLRYIRLCFRITCTSAIWGMIILWPVYATGDGGAQGWYFLSMANLKQGSVRLWVPIVFIWLQTFYVIFVMNEEYTHYLECRVDFLARGEGMVNCQQHMYSLIVERIPHELRSDRALFDYFNRLFPRKVHSTAVVLNLPDLERVSVKRKRVLRRLEKSMKSLEIKGRRPVHVVGRKRMRCCGVESFPMHSSVGKNVDDDSDVSNDYLPQKGQRVDSINYYNRELTVINEKVARMQHEKMEIAQKGNNSIRPSQMISHALDRVSDAAETALGAPAQDDGLITGFSTTRRRRKSLALTILDRLGIDFISGGISYIQHNIDEVVDSVVGATMSSTGFVTFRDLATVTSAAKSTLFHKPDVLVVKMAPEPRDIIWENAHVNLGWSKGREWTANLLLSLGAILWSIPVASIQALATADQIAEIPGMSWISTSNGGAVAGFVNGYLPVVLLLTIILILPAVFYLLALHYEDRKTKSDVQKSIIGRYFYYQLANIYITVTAGSVLESLSEIIEHPSNILAILGKSLPTVVGYFLTFIMTKILAGLPLILLRGGALMRMIFLKICFREKYLTQAELDEVYKPQMLWYGWEYPNLLLVVVICFTYSCISPIIMPVGAVFFLGSWLVFKLQILTVYNPWYESGGTMFPMACHRTLIGLVCGQLTLMGYSVMREGFYQALVIFPLPLITIKMMSVFNNLYASPGSVISLERAVELDAQKDVQSSFSGDVYRQPVLSERITEPRSNRQQQLAPLGPGGPGGRMPKLEMVDVADTMGSDSGKIV